MKTGGLPKTQGLATIPKMIETKSHSQAPDNNTSRQPVRSTSPAEQDATLAHMLAMKRPMNLETYLAMEYPEGAPKQLSAEQWASVPDVFKQKLPDAPLRDNFPDEDQFEEALAGWQTRVGRIKGLTQTAKKTTP